MDGKEENGQKNETSVTKEDDNHEPKPESEDTPPGADEDEQSETEDDTIPELRRAIDELRADNTSIRSELAAVHERIDGHERDNEHKRIEQPGGAPGDVEPDEHHWYFRRVRRG